MLLITQRQISRLYERTDRREGRAYGCSCRRFVSVVGRGRSASVDCYTIAKTLLAEMEPEVSPLATPCDPVLLTLQRYCGIISRASVHSQAAPTAALAQAQAAIGGMGQHAEIHEPRDAGIPAGGCARLRPSLPAKHRPRSVVHLNITCDRHRRRLYDLWTEFCNAISGVVGDHPGGQFRHERLSPVGHGWSLIAGPRSASGPFKCKGKLVALGTSASRPRADLSGRAPAAALAAVDGGRRHRQQARLRPNAAPATWPT